MLRVRERATSSTVVAVVALVLALAGCGSSQSPSATPAPTWPSGDPFPLVAAPVDGPRLSWDLVRVDPEQDRVYLTVSKQGCTIPQEVEFSETATTVTLAVVGVELSEPCTADARALTGYVQLPTALGDRQVLHG